jgi:broad specificity phosphatase PhoE/ribonuclease HI
MSLKMKLFDAKSVDAFWCAEFNYMARHFLLTADGGSRGNPGPAGYGAVITENGAIIAELYDFIGIGTNNVAEYSGLIAGLSAIHALDHEATVDVKMDSKLVVEQMSGRWQIKHADMRSLASDARAAHSPNLVNYTWIPRDENSHADRLANKALDLQVGGGEITSVRKNFLTERLLSTEKATTIFLIRHGETPLTPMKKFSGDGPLNPQLTETGLAQAERVAAAIAILKPETIIASPLNRTKQTAEAISRATGLPINFDEAWIECSFGIWDGMSIQEVIDEYPNDYQAWVSSTSFAPPEGESYASVSLRIDEALEAIAATYPGQRVAVVTHNGTIKTAAKLAVGGPPESIFHIDVSPCSITTISIWPSDGLRALRSLNETSHLR